MKDKIISTLNSKVYLYGKLLSSFIDNIDEIYEVFQDSICTSEDKNNLLITDKKIGVDIELLVILGINIYMEDLKKHSNDILSNLESGQLVVYEGKKYKYKQCEIIKTGYYKGVEKIVLETKNGTIKIDKSQAYKISRYFGESEKLDKMEKHKTIENSRYLISKLLNQNVEELDGILNQQIIVVFESKKYMQDILNNTNIEINGEKYEFSRVFPSRYYSDKDSYINLKGNTFHSKPIFLFTSRFDVADSILGENEYCNKLIFLGEKTYDKSLTIIEDYILEEEQLDKVIFYNTYEKISTIDKLIENDIKVYALENINPRKYKVDNILIDCEKVNTLLYFSKRLLINLLNLDIDFFDKEKFIRSAFILLKMYQVLCIPICELEEKLILDESLKRLKEITESVSEYESIYNKLLKVYENFKNIYDELYLSNPKFDLLQSISDKNSIIILNNDSEINFIQKIDIIYKAIYKLKDLKYINLENEKLIFISFYDNKFINQFDLYNSNDMKNIFYYTEAIKYNTLARNLNKNLQLLYKNNKSKYKFQNEYINLINYRYDRVILNEDKNDYYNIKDINYIQYKDDINNKVFEYEDIEEDYYYDLFNKSKEILDKRIYNSGVHDYDYIYNMKACKKIIFSNNQFAYLTKNYKASCIDINDNYVVKSIDKISINDRLIFTNDKSEEDIDLMFEKIVNSNIFKKQYNEDFENVNYFKSIVKNYAQKYDNDYTLLSIELSHYGIEKVPQAIKQWTENKIVGPREKEVYEIIGKITNDNKLLNEWKVIYNSSEIIRKFKSRLKSIFKHTVRSNIEENIDNEVIKLIIDVFDDLDKYVDIVEVEKIIDLKDNNNIDSQLNCLLGEKYILQEEK